jgi:hypothetical protein
MVTTLENRPRAVVASRPATNNRTAQPGTPPEFCLNAHLGHVGEGPTYRILIGLNLQVTVRQLGAGREATTALGLFSNVVTKLVNFANNE